MVDDGLPSAGAAGGVCVPVRATGNSNCVEVPTGPGISALSTGAGSPEPADESPLALRGAPGWSQPWPGTGAGAAPPRCVEADLQIVGTDVLRPMWPGAIRGVPADAPPASPTAANSPVGGAIGGVRLPDCTKVPRFSSSSCAPTSLTRGVSECAPTRGAPQYGGVIAPFPAPLLLAWI